MSPKSSVRPERTGDKTGVMSEYPETVAATSISGLEDAPINILIVDDEPRNLAVLESVLADPSYRLVRAASAEEALLALIVDEFALLILDIQMPGMTGFELAQMIKKRKRTAHVPIIFLTAYYNEDQDVLEGYGAGAVDYLQKPVNPAVLRSKVSVFAELHRKDREVGMANRALLAEVANRRRIEEQLRDLNDTARATREGAHGRLAGKRGAPPPRSQCSTVDLCGSGLHAWRIADRREFRGSNEIHAAG